MLEVGDREEVYDGFFLSLELIVTLCVHHVDHRLKLCLFSHWNRWLFLLSWLRHWLYLRLYLLALHPGHLILQPSVVLLLHNWRILLLAPSTHNFFLEAIQEIGIVYVDAEEGDEVMMREHIDPLRALLQ